MIYVIRAGDIGPVKIGHAVYPEKRLKQLQTANHEKLWLVKVVPGDRLFEAKIHVDLAGFRIGGEWFKPTPEVIEYVENMALADYEIDDGKAYLILWRETETSRTEACNFCGVNHSHGVTDGHRSPHCVTIEAVSTAHDGTKLYQRDGYFIRTRKLTNTTHR